MELTIKKQEKKLNDIEKAFSEQKKTLEFETNQNKKALDRLEIFLRNNFSELNK